MHPTISIIIPVLNEANNIEKLLRCLSANATTSNIEIIIVDGGSTDGTPAIIAKYKKVSLIHSSRGRAKQLNAGAKKAKGSLLYFLHADTFPPKGFDQKIIQSIEKNDAGCFRLKFEKPNHFLLRIAPWFTQFHFLFFRGGDQSLFIRRKEFEQLNGFNESYIIYEDVEFINRIYQCCHFKIINDYVVTSARRFQKNGVWNLYFRFMMIHLKNWWGATPEELYQYYLRHIKD